MPGPNGRISVAVARGAVVALDTPFGLPPGVPEDCPEEPPPAPLDCEPELGPFPAGATGCAGSACAGSSLTTLLASGDFAGVVSGRGLGVGFGLARCAGRPGPGSFLAAGGAAGKAGVPSDPIALRGGS